MKSKLIPNRILDKISERGVLNVYVTGNFATPRSVDFVASSGLFDVMWFDLEHFDISTRDLAVLNLIAQGCGMNTIARIKAADYQVVMRTLETGVNGIMCAMVADAAEAAQIVSWAKFNNPASQNNEIIGQRGWNGGNMDADYGRIPVLEYIRYQNTQTVILCQIENAAALANASAVAAVPGVNGLFFGPGDYSASVGLAGQITHPHVYAAMEKVGQAASASGKWWGTVAVGAEMYGKAKAMGAQFLCPGGDVKIMNLGLKELWKSFQAVPEVETAHSASKAEDVKYH